MLLYLLVKICRFYHQNSVFVVLMLMFLSMGKNILRIYFVCVFQFEMMKPTRTRTQNIELTLYGLITANNRRSGAWRFNDLLLGKSSGLYETLEIPGWLFRNWM